ncbi:NYN domain-containing protein [Anaerocolumna sp. AGMB13025]|uniref:NYN domain-containing protein n=1 Tax=Anaerocolumna sp. AGMB13025 TaxID=3039116 RepID=UPI00241CB5DD|nr:NYN domain-containing protein [Anaerocolumna sp. AGMB13025]WFR55152.1 NYN domain-containing protein [Anaerocolumna sp. AGMB13025]
MTEEKRFAVLIDADNVSAKYIKNILDEISNYGIATYKRIYGDWTKPSAGSWKDVLLENSVTPVQQYGYTVGKNATDSAMIIDAMDILYSGNVEGFCIVSSDSDFTKLSSRLRESGMLVVGMGEKKTPKPFIAACNQFKYLDVLAETEKKGIEIEEHQMAPLIKNGEKVTDSKKPEDQNPNNKDSKTAPGQDNADSVKNMTDISVIKSAIIKMMNEVDSEEQNMNMGELGSRLVKRYPDFDVRNYGDTKLSKFLRKFDFLEIKAMGKEGSSMWVSLKSENNEIVNEKPAENKKTASNAPKRRKRIYKKK